MISDLSVKSKQDLLFVRLILSGVIEKLKFHISTIRKLSVIYTQGKRLIIYCLKF